jgi:hypothetical protein
VTGATDTRNARRLKLTSCDVPGNDAGGEGIDLRVEGLPRLVGSTCGRSRQSLELTQDWDVCAND